LLLYFRIIVQVELILKVGAVCERCVKLTPSNLEERLAYPVVCCVLGNRASIFDELNSSLDKLFGPVLILGDLRKVKLVASKSV